MIQKRTRYYLRRLKKKQKIEYVPKNAMPIQIIRGLLLNKKNKTPQEKNVQIQDARLNLIKVRHGD